MKKILLPTDFSENSIHAAKYAIELYGIEDNEFVVMNAYSTPQAGATMVYSLNEQLRKDSENRLATLKESLLSDYKEINLKTEALLGPTDGVIIERSNRQDIDLVVMGTKGASNALEMFLGSNTSAIIKNIQLPLLVVPSDAALSRPENIALAVDFEENADAFLFNEVIELSQKLNKKINVFHIQTKDKVIAGSEEYKARQDIHLNLVDVPHQIFSSTYDRLDTGIRDYVDANHVDLLIMSSRNRGFFSNFFHSSITKKIAKLTHIPLLILHD